MLLNVSYLKQDGQHEAAQLLGTYRITQPFISFFPTNWHKNNTLDAEEAWKPLLGGTSYWISSLDFMEIML